MSDFQGEEGGNFQKNEKKYGVTPPVPLSLGTLLTYVNNHKRNTSEYRPIYELNTAKHKKMKLNDKSRTLFKK